MIEYTVKVHDNGDKFWYVNDKHHRVDGPAIEEANGSKWWYVNDERHRVDGPAIEWADGSKWWFVNDKLHRLDGPAIEYAHGGKSWYINGKRYEERKFNKKIKRDKKLTIVEIEKLLGYTIKVVK